MKLFIFTKKLTKNVDKTTKANQAAIQGYVISLKQFFEAVTSVPDTVSGRLRMIT